MARDQGKVGEDKSRIIAELPAACSDEGLAVDFVERQRWADGPCCPHCGDVNVYQMKGRDGKREKHWRWRCRGCGKLYSVRTGTVLEDSRIPIRHWCFGFWRASTSKKGVSALEIKRQTGLSYKSSLFLLHRIRFAMGTPKDSEPLHDVVEVDETYVGGKPRHRNPQDRHARTAKHVAYDWRKNKAMVFGALQRGGQVRARVVPGVTGANLKEALLNHVCRSAKLITDEHPAYRKIGRRYREHHTVCHSAREYVRGDITTNTIEGFFGILKRGINGIYHNVSKERLQLYLNEFEFRYNRRHLEDGDRVIAAIKAADGKRLTYKEPAKKAV